MPHARRLYMCNPVEIPCSLCSYRETEQTFPVFKMFCIADIQFLSLFELGGDLSDGAVDR